MRTCCKNKTHKLAAAISLIIASELTLAKDAETHAPKLEEIIVTAQKRVENLQDVPLSVSAVSGEKLEKASIENIEDLTAYLPNIHLTETGFSTQLRVRGIGSDNSQGFEQSVGMYVDGIYFGRAQLFRAPLMDIGRAELLRGPQTTLFGKNSIAGALNVSTARPTNEFEGKITVSHEIEHSQNEINGFVSGPLTKSLNGRLAVRSYTEDGYFGNSYTGSQEPQSEEQSVRLSLDWAANDKLNVFFKAQRDEFEAKGRSIEITKDVPLTSGGASYADHLALFGQPALESDIRYNRQIDLEDVSDNEINNYLLNIEYDLGDNTLTLVTGLLDFNYTEICDCDNTASEILDLRLGEDYSQFSQEIRIASPVGETFEWLGGIFYQQWEQAFYDQLNVSETNLLPNLISGALSDTGVIRDFEQESVAWSAFVRGTWNINEKWHLTLGARVTQEEKEATKILNVIEPSTNNILNGRADLANLYLAVFQTETEQLANSGHNLNRDRTETPVTPFVNVKYDFNDEIMLYGSFSVGSKAGGFDPRSNTSLFFEFEEETATAIEVGAKTTTSNGRGEFNLAVFRTDYDDLQISQFDGVVGFNPSNAAKTRVQGIEIDGRYALSDELTASYGIAYLDFEYRDFKNGNCYAGQTPNGVDLDGDTTIDTCDYTGKSGVYTPNVSANFSFDYNRPITDDISFASLLDIQYVGQQQVHVNLDPSGEIDSYYFVSLRVGFETDTWSVAMLGKNLFDEYILSYSANAPLSETSFNTNTHYSFIRRPLTVAVEASYRF